MLSQGEHPVRTYCIASLLVACHVSIELRHAYYIGTMLMIRFAGRAVHRDKLARKSREEIIFFPRVLGIGASFEGLYTLGRQRPRQIS